MTSGVTLGSEQQAFAETAAGMRHRKIFCREAATFQKCNRKCISHCERRRRAGCWCEIEWAGFFSHADVEMHISSLGKRRIGIARHCDGRVAGW
jgi:hypothetical protein